MERVLGAEIETTDECLRPIVDGLPLFGSPLEVESGVYDLSPTTEFNREVERRPQDAKILNRRSPRFFQEFDSAW